MVDKFNEESKRIKESIPTLVGKRIKDLREAKGLSQVELADKIGSDRQYLYKIESAKVSVSMVKLAIIANALDISLADFFSKGF
ncbi:MAG: helix-turn-helix domain-containing protein [Flavobacteriales bacterium]